MRVVGGGGGYGFCMSFIAVSPPTEHQDIPMSRHRQGKGGEAQTPGVGGGGGGMVFV